MGLVLGIQFIPLYIAKSCKKGPYLHHWWSLFCIDPGPYRDQSDIGTTDGHTGHSNSVAQSVHNIHCEKVHSVDETSKC